MEFRLRAKIYPNPASTHISVKSGENALMSIFSNDEQLILTQKMETSIEQIDVQHLFSALYLLKIENSNIQNTISFLTI